MAEKEQAAKEPETLSDVYDRIETYGSESAPAPDEPESKEESPAAPDAAKEDDATLEAEPAEAEEDEDEAKAAESEDDEESTLETPQEPESTPEEPTEPGRPEAVEASPEGEEPPKEEDDPEIWTADDGKTFHRSDLYDETKIAEFREALTQGYMRYSDYHAKRQREAGEVRQINAAFEDSKRLMKELASDPEMASIIVDYGQTTDVVDRLIANPQLARAILANPVEKERLRTALESERDQPELRQRREATERLSAENAQYQQRAQVQQMEQRLVSFGSALKQTVANYAEQYPGIETGQVENYVLSLAGLTADDFNPVKPERVGPGLLRLSQIMVEQGNDGVERIRPHLIVAEFDRLKSAVKPKSEPKAKDAKTETHNAAVTKKIEDSDDGPPAVPAGEAPGLRTPTPQPKDLDEVRDRIAAYADQT